MNQATPFHSGELAVQQRAGETGIARRNSGAISSSILAGARPFLKLQPMVLLSSRDERDGMWASIVFGKPGFLNGDAGTYFDVDLNAAIVDENDPVWANIEREGRLGSLVIELASRRRIRINGHAHIDDERRLHIEVEEAYPACPKYINRRHVRLVPGASADAGSAISGTGAELSEADLAALHSADVMFVATRSQERGYDLSHRGGSPGFMKLSRPGTIRWPEFPGNSMFNTLGNLLHDPHAGLVIPDFVRGVGLQVIGKAETIWDQPDPANETGGTRRFVELKVERWRKYKLPSNLVTEFLDHSPFNPGVQS